MHAFIFTVKYLFAQLQMLVAEHYRRIEQTPVLADLYNRLKSFWAPQ